MPLYSHVVQTILKQGHLRPLPLHAGPIDWAYDHALRLYPLPDILLLGDRAERFEAHCGDAKAANPGSFASDLTFYTYTPASRELQACQCALHEVDIAEQERRRGEGLGTKIKKKSRKDATRKKQKLADNERAEHARTPKDQIAKKKKSTMTPRNAKETSAELGREPQQGINAFFMPAHRGAILNSDVEIEEEEEQIGEGRKRRVRRLIDSDSDTSSGEETGTGDREGGEREAGEEEEEEGMRRESEGMKKARKLQDSDDDDEEDRVVTSASESEGEGNESVGDGHQDDEEHEG